MRRLLLRYVRDTYYRRLLLLGALCSGVGCAKRPSQYYVHIDPSLTPTQVEQVSKGLDDWTSATGVVFWRVIESDSCSYELIEDSGCIHITYASSEQIEAMRGSGVIATTANIPHFIYGTPGWSSTIYFSDDTFGPCSVDNRIIEHELGHSLGLYHESDSLMAPDCENNPGHITQKDIDQYWNLR